MMRILPSTRGHDDDDDDDDDSDGDDDVDVNNDHDALLRRNYDEVRNIDECVTNQLTDRRTGLIIEMGGRI